MGDSPATSAACRRCGTCCQKGGPALHGADLPLIRQGWLHPDDLITIRQGEPVFSPLTNGIEPARTELIKISGKGDSWACRFFNPAAKACGLYAHRPLECRLLQCWEPTALTSVIYEDCLRRQDIVPDNGELKALIELQEGECAFATLAAKVEAFKEGNDRNLLTEISRLVTLDLRIRQRAVQALNLSLGAELLYFGRPLFKSLAFHGLAIQEGPQGVTVVPSSFGTQG